MPMTPHVVLTDEYLLSLQGVKVSGNRSVNGSEYDESTLHHHNHHLPSLSPSPSHLLLSLLHLSLPIDVRSCRLEEAGLLCPSLTSLTLQNLSYLPSIRDLGNSFRSLTSLHVESCQLSDLEGIAYMSSLRDLNIRHNPVRDFLPLSDLEDLKTLWASRCEVEEEEQLDWLESCRELREVELRDNPFAAQWSSDQYRHHVMARLPNLTRLDNQDVASDERNRHDHDAHISCSIVTTPSKHRSQRSLESIHLANEAQLRDYLRISQAKQANNSDILIVHADDVGVAEANTIELPFTMPDQSNAGLTALKDKGVVHNVDALIRFNNTSATRPLQSRSTSRDSLFTTPAEIRPLTAIDARNCLTSRQNTASSKVSQPKLSRLPPTQQLVPHLPLSIAQSAGLILDSSASLGASDLSSGREPICGSFIDIARQRRRSPQLQSTSAECSVSSKYSPSSTSFSSTASPPDSLARTAPHTPP